MKKLILTLKVMAVLIILTIVNDSAYSQNVISSVSVNKNAATLTKSLANEKSGSIVLSKDAENWMSNKNYLDISSLNFNYYIMISLNEKVIEKEKEIESWMLDEDFWQIIPDYQENIIETDKSSIEDWMLDDKFWIIVD